MNSDAKLNQHTRPTAIIIGAGVTGIAMSYYLTKKNIDHIILEKAEDVGGIWSAQNWPGMRPDTEINSYAYSFRPFISKELLVPGKSVAQYLKNVAHDFGIIGHVQFGVVVEDANFDTVSGEWRINTNAGAFTSSFLINANGYFADDPHTPHFKGEENFEGDILHLAHVDDATPLTNKNLVLVGSGASAISSAPALSDKCKHLTLLQRSPSYIFEEPNKAGPITRLTQILHRMGVTAPMKIMTYLMKFKWDLVFLLIRRFPNMGKAFFDRHWKHAIDGETYDENFHPSYNPWEQRIAVSVGLKKALHDHEMRMVTGHIESFQSDGILLTDGRRVDADMCILATGYNMRLFKFDVSIDGQPVDTRQLNFYKGMMMGGIPNYFQPFGTVHTSWTYRIEMVAKLVTKIMVHMRKNKFNVVSIDRKPIYRKPRITPNYVLRYLAELPVIYGSFEIPTIDKWLYYFFRRKNYNFGDVQNFSPEHTREYFSSR
jgi:monooxygenase